jgi:phage terminase large subunit-like protein
MAAARCELAEAQATTLSRRPDYREMESQRREARRCDRHSHGHAERDGAAVPIGVEFVAGYKDTYTTIRDILKGKRTVRRINVSSDNVVCAGEVEPIFEAGHVHMRRAWWNDRALTQLAQFPAGSHDVIADVIAKGYIMAYKLTVRPAKTIQA